MLHCRCRRARCRRWAVGCLLELVKCGRARAAGKIALPSQEVWRHGLRVSQNACECPTQAAPLRALRLLQHLWPQMLAGWLASPFAHGRHKCWLAGGQAGRTSGLYVSSMTPTPHTALRPLGVAHTALWPLGVAAPWCDTALRPLGVARCSMLPLIRIVILPHQAPFSWRIGCTGRKALTICPRC